MIIIWTKGTLKMPLHSWKTSGIYFECFDLRVDGATGVIFLFWIITK